jgi:MOSC domain-containing protein YiiM
MAATLVRDEHGQLIRKAGVMAVVRSGGYVKPGDTIRIELPSGPPQPLEVV